MITLPKFETFVKRIVKSLWLCCIPRGAAQVIATCPHDTNAFTQGLIVEKGLLYESTGLIGESSIRRLSYSEEAPELNQSLPNHWGEGIACQGNEIYQLTWKSQVAIVYGLPNLLPVREVAYKGEGWGLASFNDGFVMTDGSAEIQFLNSNFELVRKLIVKIKGRPLDWLNDLIYARGTLFVNRLNDNNIYQICPVNARVEKIWDCTRLLNEVQPLGDEDHLNGIAYNEDKQQFIVSGKRWSKLFFVKF